jgi:hypothetical protein
MPLSTARKTSLVSVRVVIHRQHAGEPVARAEAHVANDLRSPSDPIAAAAPRMMPEERVDGQLRHQGLEERQREEEVV